MHQFTKILRAGVVLATLALTGCMTFHKVDQQFARPDERMLYNVVSYDFNTTQLIMRSTGSMASAGGKTDYYVIPAEGHRFLNISTEVTNSGSEAKTFTVNNFMLTLANGESYVPSYMVNFHPTSSLDGSTNLYIQNSKDSPASFTSAPQKKEYLILYYQIPKDQLPVSVTVFGETKPIPPPVK